MMAAVQPFLSGAISKTVNMPETATAEEIEQVYLEGWRLGLKAIAIYRDNCKRTPAAQHRQEEGVHDEKAVEVVAAEAVAAATADSRRASPARRPAGGGPGRGHQAAPPAAPGRAHSGHPQVRQSPATRATSPSACYPDGQPGEIFLKMAKEGSTVSGLMDSLAISISLALQYGVPLRDLVNKFAHVRFEPSGFTGNPEIPIAKSIVDYIFRWLGSRFLPKEEREALGILDRSGEGREDEPSATAGISAAGDAPTGLPRGPTAVAATAPSSAPAAGSAGPAGIGRSRGRRTGPGGRDRVSCRHGDEPAPRRARADSRRDSFGVVRPIPAARSVDTASQLERSRWDRSQRRLEVERHATGSLAEVRLPGPGGRPQLRGLRLDHGPQRLLLQVPELRQHERLQLIRAAAARQRHPAGSGDPDGGAATVVTVGRRAYPSETGAA